MSSRHCKYSVACITVAVFIFLIVSTFVNEVGKEKGVLLSEETVLEQSLDVNKDTMNLHNFVNMGGLD